MGCAVAWAPILGQKSEITVPAGPCSLWACRGQVFRRLFQVLVALGAAELVAASLHSVPLWSRGLLCHLFCLSFLLEGHCHWL